MRLQRGGLQFATFCSGLGGLSLLWLDERLDLRKWKRVSYTVNQRDRESEPIKLSVRCRTRPPPIGCMEWPAGRVLLQWALDEGGLGKESSGTVLELGAGIGLTAIGLATARTDHRTCTSQIVATDTCEDTLSLLRANAAAHGFDSNALRVAKWDAAQGSESLATLPCKLEDVTHVLGADVIYHGFGVHRASDNTAPQHVAGEQIGLAHTFAALLERKPLLPITLLAVDRFSGGAVAALSNVAGVNTEAAPTTVDPAISRFVQVSICLRMPACNPGNALMHHV